MPWNPQRPQQLAEENLSVCRQRLHQSPIRERILAERAAGLFDRPLEHRNAAVVKRMGQGRERLHQLEPMLRKWKHFEKRRRNGERMNRRTDVMHERGQRQSGRAGSSADRRSRFDHQGGIPLARSVIAAANPLGPDPTTTASYELRDPGIADLSVVRCPLRDQSAASSARRRLTTTDN